MVNRVNKRQTEDFIGWTSRKLTGYPVMTVQKMIVLMFLRDSADAGYPFAIVEAQSRTIQTLMVADLIVRSPGLDGERYKITGRGRKTLEVYLQPLKRRSDGICPRCGERPLGVYKSGNRTAYCKPCQAERSAERYAEKGYEKNPGICPTCGVREKHITSTGNVRSYCQPCRRKYAKKERRRRQKRLNWKIDIGLPVLCIKCKERQRVRHGKTVYDYCHECYREYMNEYYYRKMWEKHIG